MKQIKILKYFIYATLLIIGIITGIAIRHYHNIPLSTEINLIDMATLVVTIFLAVYIPEVLDRKLQNKRDKKELIESRIIEFQSMLRSVNSMVQSQDKISYKGYLTIKNILSVSHNKLNTISMLLGYSELDASFEKEMKELRAIVKEHESILIHESKEGEEFSFSDEIQSEEERLYNKIDIISSQLIFHISNS